MADQQRWEYLVVFIEDNPTPDDQAQFDDFLDADKYTQKLNHYGEAGWEMVSFHWEKNGGKAAFKRPKLS